MSVSEVVGEGEVIMKECDRYYKHFRYKLSVEYDVDDKVYYARFPELPGCMAHGQTKQAAVEFAMRVKDDWLDATYEKGWEIPEPTMLVQAGMDGVK